MKTLLLYGALAGVCAWTGCRDGGGEPIAGDSGIRPRVFNPPPSRVRAVPPHHIHEGGIGPYELGASLKKTLNMLPHGPRIELFRLGRLADFSLARTENGALLVGIERDVGVRFISAIESKIVITKGGVGVGSPIAAAAEELGPAVRESDRAFDPRIHRFQGLPGVIFVGGNGKSGDRIGAIMVDAAYTDDSNPADPPKPTCSLDDKLRDRLRGAARHDRTAHTSHLCEGTEVIGAVVHDSRRLTWLTVEKGKIRRGGGAVAPKLAFATAVGGSEGGIHVAAVREERNAQELRLVLEVWRVEGTRLISLGARRIYSIAKSEASWVGGTLANIELLAEIRVVSATELAVRGLYLERNGERVVMIAPLKPGSFSLKRKLAAKKDADKDAGSGDAASARRDAGAPGSAASRPDAKPVGVKKPKEPKPRRGLR